MSNFHRVEVVGRGSETQLQLGENSNYLTQRFSVKVCSNSLSTGCRPTRMRSMVNFIRSGVRQKKIL